MSTARRFLVATLVPALIAAIFAVGGVAANGPSGKVELCHWASHRFVSITVSMNALPAHLGHGDVEPDEYGDCAGDQEGDEDEDGDVDADEGSEADEESEADDADEGPEHEGDEAGEHDGWSHRSNGRDNDKDD